jgi:hypothetical protein
MRHDLIIESHGDHVHIDAASLPPHLAIPIVVALASDLGIELASLEKASAHGEGPDPRYPELNALVTRLRSTWNRWANWLAQRLIDSLGKGDPTSTVTAREIQRILFEHEAGTTAAITGHHTDTLTVRGLQARGLLTGDEHYTAPIPQAFTQGLGIDPRQPHPVPLPSGRTPPQEAPKGSPLMPPEPRRPLEVIRRPLTPQQEGALAYTRTRAAIYLRRPISGLRTAAERSVLDMGAQLDWRQDDHAAITATVELGITRTLTPSQVAKEIRATVLGPTAEADLDRIARTELQAAHSAGALVALRAMATEPDPLVYKIASPGACVDCRRIWGHPANPVQYRLSAVVGRDNFRLPRSEWGPTVGPTHPACTCPPLQLWHADIHDAVQDIAADMRKIFGS